MINFLVIWIISLIVFCNCNAQESYLSKIDFDNRNTNSTKLSSRLREISGLAVGKNYLIAHQDEKAIVFKLNKKTFKIVDHFFVGKLWAVEDDFEGVAIVKNKFYLITSSGGIYEFIPGVNKEMVKYNFYDTKLSSSYDVEGLCFDDETNSLLIACKGSAGKGYKGMKAVYSFSLKNYKLDKAPRFLIDIREIKDDYNCKEFTPSGIAKIKSTGNFLILSSKSKPSIIEMNKNGKIIDFKKLNKKIHKQAEGIEIIDGNLVISDEGDGGRAHITVYNVKVNNE